MLHEENHTLYMCPNMIKFDEVDFSECHSEEVMFLLTLSVFMHIPRIMILEYYVRGENTFLSRLLNNMSIHSQSLSLGL